LTLAGGSSWESFLHDVWSIDDDNDNDSTSSADDDSDNEAESSEAADKDGDAAGAAASAVAGAGLGASAFFQHSSAASSYLTLADAVAAGAAQSPALAPAAAGSLLLADPGDFTLYPSLDEFFSSDLGASSFDGELAPLPLQSPPQPQATPAAAAAAAASASLSQPLDVAPAALFNAPAAVDPAALGTLLPAPSGTVHPLAASSAARVYEDPLNASDVPPGPPRQDAGAAPVDPAGAVTPAKRKPRMEDSLCAAIVTGAVVDPDAAAGVARILDLDSLPPGQEEDVLRSRLADLSQAQLLELHGLVYGRTFALSAASTPAPSSPTSLASPLVQTPGSQRRRAGKARRRNTGWSKRRRQPSSAAVADMLWYASAPASGANSTVGSPLPSEDRFGDDGAADDDEEDEIDVVGI